MSFTKKGAAKVVDKEYLDYVAQLIARDGGAPVLSMKKRIYPRVKII